MNLQKLFEAQAELDAFIEQQHPTQEGENRLEKKVLALLVELGECANEWRGFKFWSNDQGGVKHIAKCESCNGKGFVDEFSHDTGHYTEECIFCNGTGVSDLLTEYVDCLHFILSIGNDLKISEREGLMKSFLYYSSVEAWTVTSHFNYTFRQIVLFAETAQGDAKPDIFKYTRAFLAILQLGKKLEFTVEQIESAYWQKYEINKQRQVDGY